MTKAQAALNSGISILEQIVNVGDKVIATIDGGSKFVTCRVYAIEANKVKFLWNNVVFSVETELASMTTVLVERFDRQTVIEEILAMVGAA